MTRRVLVTDGNYKHTLGAVRALAQSGFTVDVLGGPTCYAARSRYCREGVPLPGSVQSRDVNALAARLVSGDYDVLLPVGALSVRTISEFRGTLEPHVSMAIAPAAAIDLSFDKSLTARLAEDHGVRTPRGVVVTTGDTGVVGSMTFPLVIKGVDELTKREVQYARDSAAVDTLIRGAGARTESLLVQEYIEGHGEGFFALYDRGRCVASFMHRRIREYPASGGSSSCAVSISEPDLEWAGRRLLDALQWHGVAMVEFRRERQSGELVLMEINPKFWGSLDLAIDCGVDFPSLSCAVALAEPVEAPSPTVGRRYQWPLEGDFQHVMSQPRSMVAVLSDFVSRRTHKNIWITDPRPTLARLRVALSAIALRTPFVGAGYRIAWRTQRIGWKGALAREWTESTGCPLARYSVIDDRLVVGAQQRKWGKRKLARWGVQGTLNLRSESDDSAHGREVGAYCHIPVDEYEAPTVEQLLHGVAFIDGVGRRGGRVYVHCREGIGRAATMAAAYFVAEGRSVEEAVDRVRRVRPFIDILPVQMDSLYALEQVVKKPGVGRAALADPIP